MPDSAGIFTRLYRWAALQAAGVPNDASHADNYDDDVAQALNNRVTRDGTSAATADLPMANHSLTGIRKAAAPGEPVEFSQLAAAGGVVSNRLQNASFLVNQRNVSGTVSLAASAYGHDRWKGGAGGATYTFGTVGADVQANVSAGSLVQTVSGSDVDGATMTLSNAGTAQGRVYPLGGAAPAFSALPLTVTNLSPGTAAVVEFTGGTVLEPQLEPGGTAHGFARRPFATDMVLCQSLYEIFPYDITVSGISLTVRVPFFYRARKPFAPTLTNTTTTARNGEVPTLENRTLDGFTFAANPANGTYTSCVGVVVASCEP